MLRKMLILIALFSSVPSFSETVPDKIRERAAEIVEFAGGKQSTILTVERSQAAPGLDHATLVVYTDGIGNTRYLTMLPDGENFYIWQSMRYPRGSGAPTSVPAATSRAPAPAPVQRPSSEAGSKPASRQAYELDSVLGVEDFSREALSKAFEDPETAPETYFGLLDSAPAIEDGKSDNIYYVLYDPGCSFCRKKYDLLRPYIDAGHLTVHWIPVASASRPPFTALFALADPGASNDERLDRLRALATNTPKKVSIGDKDMAAELLMQSTFLLGMLRNANDPDKQAGTPQSFYRTPGGELRQHYGAHENHLKELLQDFNIPAIN